MSEHECPRCRESHGPLWIFRSDVISMKICWFCLVWVEMDARAAGVEFTVSPA